jgi:ABC-type polysaccharide/polyol phosphate transport system ATPase subunit
MGIPLKEIKANVDKIIEFAELEEFLEFPVKNYSSGMNARLGFACATVIKPAIILIDEVLAVGDEKFQLKCFNRMQELKSEGKGIVLVSHDMGLVEKFCDRVCVLHRGDLKYYGATASAIACHRELMGL